MQIIKYLPLLSIGLAILGGAIFGMVLSGFGPWAAGLSVGRIGGALVAAVIVSWLGAVFLQTRWLAAVLFSLPLALGLALALLSRHWGRCIALSVCIVVPFVVVGLFGVDRRRVQDHGA